jgi:GNAT superfamily N-acetyltransferase
MEIRRARLEDVPSILRLIGELAEYEKALDEVKVTQIQIIEHFFCTDPKVFCDLVVSDEGPVVGFAVWFLNYSTWTGTHGIYLEDLYVEPDFRGRGYGRSLLVHLARICVEKGYQRLQWWVLDWNAPSIEFYRSLGATPMDEWTTYRVTGEALRQLGEPDPQ